MKAKFIALAALVLGMVSCQQDFDGAAQVGGEVDFQLAVAAPELAGTRADGDSQNGHNSAFGAIDYLTDWSDVDLRYTLEVYDVKDNVVTNLTPVKDRMEKIVEEYTPVTFDLRLVPGREYRFVVFADFVKDDGTAFHVIGKTLQDITLANDAINEELTDAYFDYEDITVSNSAAQDMTLTRPFGKVRVIATDLAELNLNVNPGKVTVAYETTVPNKFNAVTGKIDAVATTQSFEFPYAASVSKETLADHYYTVGYDAMVENGRHTHMTLFTDYILATEEMAPIQFTMTVYDKNGDNEENIIKTTEFNTDIPVQRNHLTTIIGNVLTTATEINVDINDDFCDKCEENIVLYPYNGIINLDKNYNLSAPFVVEAGEKVTLNLNGFTLKNRKENLATDVIIVEEGAELTINGEGTIEAVSGNDGYAVIAEGTVIINGGEFKSGVDANGAPNAVVYARGNGKVFVNGGVFHNEHTSKFVLNKKDADRATTTIKVRGGRFQNFNPANNEAENAGTNFMDEGYGVIEKENNWFEVVTMINVKNGEEFKAAAKESKYAYINIVDDIDCGTEFVVVNTDKIILGNGKKFIAGGKTTKSYALGFQGGVKAVVNDLVLNGGGGIYVSGGSNVEVNNVTLKIKYSASGRHMFYVNNATLTVNSGNFEVLNTGYHYFSMENNANVFVKGGTFAGMLDSRAPVYSASGAVLEISGGKFWAGSRPFNPTAWLAEGYTAAKEGSYWVVK